jgi:hypothetical protein
MQVSKIFHLKLCYNHLVFCCSNLLSSKVLPKEDKETIELCRTMQQRGECPPLLVVFDSLEGYLELTTLSYLLIGNLSI